MKLKIHEQLSIFVENPVYPSLRNHKLEGGLKDKWSISVEDQLRMVYFFEDDGVITFIDIGTHDEVYGK